MNEPPNTNILQDIIGRT